jgi:hypothetical protein
MKIRQVTEKDIPKWMQLSTEHDRYVKELVSDLALWYEGNENLPSFKNYMESKISKKEAFIAVDELDICLGIIAISHKNNNITFFAVSHRANIEIVGNKLLHYAFALLDETKSIHINEIQSTSDWIKKYQEVFISNGFVIKEKSFEHGVPVTVFEKRKNCLI